MGCHKQQPCVHTRVSTRPLREPPPVGTRARGCFQVSWSSRVDGQGSRADDSHIPVSSPSHAHPRPLLLGPPAGGAGLSPGRGWRRGCPPHLGADGGPSPSPSDGLCARCQAPLAPHVGGPLSTRSLARSLRTPRCMRAAPSAAASHVALCSCSSTSPGPQCGHSLWGFRTETQASVGGHSDGRTTPTSSLRRPPNSSLPTSFAVVEASGYLCPRHWEQVVGAGPEAGKGL